jgi:hypothetical protein
MISSSCPLSSASNVIVYFSIPHFVASTGPYRHGELDATLAGVAAFGLIGFVSGLVAQESNPRELDRLGVALFNIIAWSSLVGAPGFAFAFNGCVALSLRKKTDRNVAE